MRVLFLCTDAYGGHGGIALYNRDLALALSLHDACEEVMVIPRVIRRDPETIPERVRFVAGAARGPVAYARAVLAARNQKFDLVLCGHVNLLPLVRIFGAPSLLMLYGIEAWKPPARRFAATSLDSVDGVISISEITLRRFLSWSGFSGKTFLLPNAIHGDWYSVRSPRPDLVERYGLTGKRVLLTVGRLVEEERYKGFDEVLEVLPDLPADVVYMIAGGGDDLTRLRRKVDDLGLGLRVLFTGNFPEEEKADLYALADAYVMPSRGEGFGFVFLEALASGLPCIGSRHDGGCEALLGGELGRLVDPSSPAEIRAAILDAVGRPKEIPARLEHFSFENFMDRTRSMIDAVAARPESGIKR